MSKKQKCTFKYVEQKVTWARTVSKDESVLVLLTILMSVKAQCMHDWRKNRKALDDF